MPYSRLLKLVKMRLLRLLSISTAFVLVCCCAGGEKNFVNEAFRVRCDEFNMEEGSQDIVASVDYLVLEPSASQLLGEIDKVVILDGRIYVGDYKSQRILVFNEDGKMLNVLDKRGRGPGEYLMMRSFSIANGNLYVLDDFEFTIRVYDLETLAYRQSMKSPVFATDFSALDDGGFLFAFAPLSENLVADKSKRYRVVVTDADMQIRHRFFPYGEKEVDALCFNQYLSEAGEFLVYGTFREDGYCLFSRQDGHLEEHVAFDLTRPIPASERSSIQAVSERKYNYMMNVPYCSGDYLVFNISAQDVGGTCVYNRRSGQFLKPRQNGINHMLVGIIGGAGNQLIGNWVIKTNYENLVKNGFERAEIYEEAAILADAPFLVFYQLKE